MNPATRRRVRRFERLTVYTLAAAAYAATYLGHSTAAMALAAAALLLAADGWLQ